MYRLCPGVIPRLRVAAACAYACFSNYAYIDSKNHRPSPANLSVLPSWLGFGGFLCTKRKMEKVSVMIAKYSNADSHTADPSK
jgi:hypothetical protein